MYVCCVNKNKINCIELFANGRSVLVTDLSTFFLIFVSVVEPNGMLHQDLCESHGFLLPKTQTT